jgi:hypothetical protein
VNLVEKSAERVPLDVEVQNNKLGIEGLQQRNNFRLVAGATHYFDTGYLFEVRFQAVAQDWEIAG